MRLWLTGGTGFVGSNIVEVALERGAEVMTTVHSYKPPVDALYATDRIEMTDDSAVGHSVAAFEPDVVVHRAILNHWERIYSDRRAAWDAYVTSTRSIARSSVCWRLACCCRQRCSPGHRSALPAAVRHWSVAADRRHGRAAGCAGSVGRPRRIRWHGHRYLRRGALCCRRCCHPTKAAPLSARSPARTRPIPTNPLKVTESPTPVSGSVLEGLTMIVVVVASVVVVDVIARCQRRGPVHDGAGVRDVIRVLRGTVVDPRAVDAV